MLVFGSEILEGSMGNDSFFHERLRGWWPQTQIDPNPSHFPHDRSEGFQPLYLMNLED